MQYLGIASLKKSVGPSSELTKIIWNVTCVALAKEAVLFILYL